MSLAMRQVKSCAKYIETLKALEAGYRQLDMVREADNVAKNIPIWEDHLAYWEKELIEETKEASDGN